ncbi:MAG: cytochrome c [Nitrospirota bacterium]|nr:cytochrome c [Nitrospirota bacterium]
MNRFCVATAVGVLMGLSGGTFALAGEPDAERQAVILEMVTGVCGMCHGADLSGGLGPALTPEALKGKDAAAVAEIILNGRPDTPMAPFAGVLNTDDAAWLARKLKSGIGH